MTLKEFAAQSGISYENARQLKARNKIVKDGDRFRFVTAGKTMAVTPQELSQSVTPVCDCHTFTNQVCDICQGVTEGCDSVTSEASEMHSEVLNAEICRLSAEVTEIASLVREMDSTITAQHARIITLENQIAMIGHPVNAVATRTIGGFSGSAKAIDYNFDFGS